MLLHMHRNTSVADLHVEQSVGGYGGAPPSHCMYQVPAYLQCDTHDSALYAIIVSQFATDTAVTNRAPPRSHQSTVDQERTTMNRIYRVHSREAALD
jgi:hypothetical protein